jgi:hypothetical protein
MKNQILMKVIVISLVLFGFCSFAMAQKIKPEVVAAGTGRWVAGSNGITYIPVCWENAGEYSTEAQWVRSAIESSWEYYANVDFQSWGDCSSGSRGIRILLEDSTPRSLIGRGMDGVYGGMKLNFTFNNFSAQYCRTYRKFCIEAVAVHEFGHALGLAHEQDTANSLCHKDQDLTSGAVSITPYDKDSVMNYCNKNWNNGGSLSYYDIQGIQQIYGKRNSSETYGYISVADELGDDQVWEEVVISLGSSAKSFTVNKSQPSNSVKWSFSGSGTYCFKFSTRALHADGNIYKGYGEKCYILTGGKNYSTLSLSRDDWNGSGYYNLVLK